MFFPIRIIQNICPRVAVYYGNLENERWRMMGDRGNPIRIYYNDQKKIPTSG